MRELERTWGWIINVMPSRRKPVRMKAKALREVTRKLMGNQRCVVVAEMEPTCDIDHA